MKELLSELAQQAGGYVELRYHKRLSNSLLVQKGRVDVSHHSEEKGIGVRCLVNGAWGFSSSVDVSRDAIKRAIQNAQDHARLLADDQKTKRELAKGDLAREDFVGAGFEELQQMPLEAKLQKVIELEKQLAGNSSSIQSARARYKEILEEKVIVTSDGAAASLRLAQPELSLTAIAAKDGEQVAHQNSAGVSGGWQCLINHPSLNNVVDETSRIAVDLLRAKYPDGGKKTVILSPALVGLLCHEAIGHTVEADFVKAGSVAQGKIGKRVASSLVNLNDSGWETISGYAVGNMPFDDEGIKTQTTEIIKGGILTSFLHNRETAAEFGVAPTGNARAWLYHDEPLIRMRNTYMLPGNQTLEEMIAGVKDGYLAEGAGSGQADSNGEFMFGCGYVWRIKNGKKVELLREATLSGIAFDVLQTVDAVSREFRWELGTGYCGKGQAAKVDAGGPYIRCRLHVGGR